MQKPEFVESSSFKKDHFFYEEHQEFLAETAKNTREQLNKLLLPEPEAKKWEKPIGNIKKYITDAHNWAGIDLTSKDFADIMLVPEDRFKDALEVVHPNKGLTRRGVSGLFLYDINSILVQIPNNQKDRIYGMVSICHELIHSTGRNLTTSLYSEDQHRVVNKTAVVGYITSGTVERGRALEEMMPLVLADYYASSANDSTVSSAHNEYLNLDNPDSIVAAQKLNSELNLRRTLMPGYSTLKNIYYKVEEIAAKKQHPNDILRELIRARIFTNERFKLHQSLTELIGFENARTLAKVSIEDTQELRYIYSKINSI